MFPATHLQTEIFRGTGGQGERESRSFTSTLEKGGTARASFAPEVLMRLSQRDALLADGPPTGSTACVEKGVGLEGVHSILFRSLTSGLTRDSLSRQRECGSSGFTSHHRSVQLFLPLSLR